MPTAPRPPAPPPLPPPDSKVVAIRRYEAAPPIGKELIEPGETVATTKEEEWVTKKTRELTTTRQIATRVQRQVLLEDGKVLSDSGPLVSTTTSEDTETQEHEHTEHRKLDDPPGSGVDAIDGPTAEIEDAPKISGELVPKSTPKWVPVANPDGKVREVKEKRVLTHEETDEVKEVEERQHYGDITDKAYLKAVSSGVEDIRQALRSCTDEELTKALVATGPTLIHESTKTKKTIDTEEKEESRALQPDGQLLTESKVTTEHEEINDEDLPDQEGKSLSSGSQEVVREAGQKWRQTRDQEYVDHMAGGVRLNREMRYNADTEEGEKFGDPEMEDPHDWDSLSARVRRQRRQGQKTLMQRQRDAELYERKDALTKKPIDYDLEEETRKKETSKWLEHHFGSDSRSSRDSIGDELEEGPSTSYFNVTIKSQPTNQTRAKSPPRQKPYVAQVTSSSRVFVPSPEPEAVSPPTRVKGYYQGISEWSQRRAEEARNHSDRSPPSPVHPRTLRSPALQRDDSAYVSSSTVNAPYRRSSPERASPFQSLDRRDSSERAYSPYRAPPKQVAQPQYRSPQEEDIRYDRGPAPPERKRAMERKQRNSDDSNRYDSGYRSQSKNDLSYRGEEPAPDYSPPRPNRDSRSPPRSSSPQVSRSSRKPTQRTRFASDESRPAVERRSVGAAIGQSIRKLVGKIRSASQERRTKQKSKRCSRSPSPRRTGPLSSSYQQYGSVDSDPPAVRPLSRAHAPQSATSSDMERRAPASPLQRYYLGEDPFGGSIYGRENKYDGAKPQRTSSRKQANGHINGNGINGINTSSTDEHRSNFTTTLGRFSKSTSRLTNNGYSVDDYSRNSQTLPRKLVDEQIQSKSSYHQSSSPAHNRDWDHDRLNNNKRSSSTINVSIVNVTPPSSSIGINRPINGTTIQGPIKPARTYKALNRSKSFNVHAMEPLNDTPKSNYFGNSNRLNNSNIYKSNPHLTRLDETPEQLKSPGIVSIISRSQRDLSNAVQREEEDNLNSSRFSKKTSYTNGYHKSHENGIVNDKKKIFMKGLLEKAPELYHTLKNNDEVDGINGRSKSPLGYNNTPIKNGIKKQSYFSEDIHYKSADPYRRDTSSPYRPLNGVDKFKSSEGYTNGYNMARRGSANSDNFSETFRTTSRSDDPRRPSVTNTVQTVSKKTIPSKDGRTKETIESSERTTVTKSRYVGEPMSNLKYIENGGRLNGFDYHRRGSGQSLNERRGSNGVVIEVRDFRK